MTPLLDGLLELLALVSVGLAVLFGAYIVGCLLRDDDR